MGLGLGRLQFEISNKYVFMPIQNNKFSKNSFLDRDILITYQYEKTIVYEFFLFNKYPKKIYVKLRASHAKCERIIRCSTDPYNFTIFIHFLLEKNSGKIKSHYSLNYTRRMNIA